MARWLWWIGLFGLSMGVIGHLSAQTTLDAYFEVTNTRPHIGEPVDLFLIISYTEDIQILQRPRLSGQWGIFQILEQGEREIINTGERIVEKQYIRLVAWQTGDHALPTSHIVYRIGGRAEIITYQIPSTFFSIPSILQDDAIALRPYEAAIVLPYLPAWAFMLGISIITGIFIGIAQLFIYYRKQQISIKTMPSPYTIFLKNLAELKQTPDALTLSNALRDYLRAEFSIDSNTMTNAEIITGLKHNKRLYPHQIDGLAEILEHLTLHKFADALVGYPPQRLVSMTHTWLKSVVKAQMDDVV